jgi:hypothetical protein
MTPDNVAEVCKHYLQGVRFLQDVRTPKLNEPNAIVRTCTWPSEQDPWLIVRDMA